MGNGDGYYSYDPSANSLGFKTHTFWVPDAVYITLYVEGTVYPMSLPVQGEAHAMAETYQTSFGWHKVQVWPNKTTLGLLHLTDSYSYQTTGGQLDVTTFAGIWFQTTGFASAYASVSW